MRGRFSIIIFIGAMLVLLVGLNAASYVRVEREAELEAKPDRSTLNAGASGTRALYEFLDESGQRVMRWRESPAALSKATNNSARPSTFVFIGPPRIEFTEEDAQSLMEWVEAGGRLVVIDRTPQSSLIEGNDWRITPQEVSLPDRNVRADDAESLTRDAPALAPAQPTLLTRDVASVAPSRFASRLLAVRVEREPDEKITATASAEATGTPIIVASDDPDAESGDAATGDEIVVGNQNTSDDAAGSNQNAGSGVRGTTDYDLPPPPPKPLPTGAPDGDPRMAESVSEVDETATDEALEEATQASAPVYHVSDARGALLLDLPRGQGRIVVLSDPFIVANRGIGRADNLQLAVNIIGGANAGDDTGGLIAFDEYHQGRGVTQNQFAAYFAGTPVLAMCAQLFLIAAAIVWTRGRRFARPLPAPRVDRRSKLEFVASMAELQQRARAFDLAIENIYGRTRRALARYGGADVSAPHAIIAAGVAARSGKNKDEIESLMRRCEDAINGEPTSARQSLALVASLRELERALGIRMRAREIKQAGAR